MIRAAKYVLTILVVIFMVAIYVTGMTPSTPMSELAEKIGAVEQTGELEQENELQTARFLSIYPENCKEIHYWKTTDGMKADEVAVVEAESDRQAGALKDAFDKRVEDQLGAFEGYAPEEEAKLKSHVLKQRGNYLLYAVGTSDAVAAWTAVFDGIQ